MGGYYADPEQDCQVYHVCLQVLEDNHLEHLGHLGRLDILNILDISDILDILDILIPLQDADLNLYPVSFLCPNGTIFNQEIFVCDWWSVEEDALAGHGAHLVLQVQRGLRSCFWSLRSRGGSFWKLGSWFRRSLPGAGEHLSLSVSCC